MKKRELLQAIERMPHEAEVEISVEASRIAGLGANLINSPLVKVEYVDGKIRLS